MSCRLFGAVGGTRHAGLALRLATSVVVLGCIPLPADDWPEWRGRGRLGVWNETGIVEAFPAEGLRIRWRVPIHAGYAGPAVADGRVFVTDFQAGAGAKGTERVLCLNEKTGVVQWVHEWPADYRGLDYALGPRATPTVDGDRVYVLGAAGDLLCIQIATGEVLWKKNYLADHDAELPAWGFTSAPLVGGSLLFAVPSGRPDAKVIAFDKLTGREVWRSLDSTEAEPGYSQPTLIEAGGVRQLLVWHAGALASLDPSTGKVYWERPFKIRMNTPIATPLRAGSHLLVSAFFNGSRLYRLHDNEPDASLVWQGTSDSAVKTDTLHSLMATPIIEGGYIYGIDSFGQLRCLRLDSGERVWETQQATVEKKRNVSAFIVRHGSRYIFHNDRGELIVARLSPRDYEELSRTKLIEPTTTLGASRRELGAVNWVHPAFANRHVIIRNDREILSASLAAADYAKGN